MENLEKLESIIGKFPAQNWKFYAEKLGWSKTKFYDYAFTLQLKNKAYSKNGLWYLSTEKHEEKPNPDFGFKIGFLGYWNKRAERKHREELLERKLNLVRAARYCETVAKLNPNAESFLELAKTYREQIEMIDKELEGKDMERYVLNLLYAMLYPRCSHIL